jgi:hypothetical protein
VHSQRTAQLSWRVAEPPLSGPRSSHAEA